MGGLSLLHLFLVEVASEVFEIGANRAAGRQAQAIAAPLPGERRAFQGQKRCGQVFRVGSLMP
jgi:hypothetical protein